MRNIGRSLLRWLYTVLVYALFAGIILIVMKQILENRLYGSPFGYSLNSWLGNVYGMFLNTLGLSLVLVLLWNLLFYRHILGKRGLTLGVNVLHALFIGLHIALSAGSLWYLLQSEVAWNWALSLLEGSVECFVALLLPMLFLIPFILATRLFGPDVISYRFSAFKRLRNKIGLMYY